MSDPVVAWKNRRITHEYPIERHNLRDKETDPGDILSIPDLPKEHERAVFLILVGDKRLVQAIYVYHPMLKLSCIGISERRGRYGIVLDVLRKRG